MSVKQPTLDGIEPAPTWQDEWDDMPEFVQEKIDCYAKITFRFEDEQSLQEFADLIGQKLTKYTKSAWHPFKSHFRSEQKEWIDES